MTRLGLLLAAAVFALRPAPAAALDLKLWPLFRYASDPARGELRWSALGPLVEYLETPERRELRIRPILWLRQRRGPEPDDEADILYPLASTRWTRDYQSARFLLFTSRLAPETPTPREAAPPPASDWTHRVTLFPFVFYRSSPTQGTHLGVLPFYADVPDLFGYERVTAILFPAYLRLVEPRVDRRWYGFPFVSTVGGTDGSGMRIFPVWGDWSIAGREHTRYLLWPFHLRQTRLVPGYGWERRRLNLPVFGAIDGAGLRVRSWGMVAYTHTIDERRGYEAVGSPWPLVFRDRALGEDTYRTWRLAPVYGRSDRDGIVSRFWAWPAWRTTVQDDEDYHFRRRDAGLVLWRDQQQWNEATGSEASLRTLALAWRNQTDGPRRHGQSPALVDSLLPHTRGIATLWAPLWGVVRWDTAIPGLLDWNVLWGLVARERGRLIAPWRLALDGRGGDG